MQFVNLYQTSFIGEIRSRAEDFCVDEIQSTDFSGDGEHMWLHIQKTGCNTQFVAQKIAKALGIDNRNVSFAGLKDRHALTTQWFSAQIPGKASPEDIDLGEDIEVLEIRRHHKKLRRGQLKGNRFSIVVRDVEGQANEFDQVVESVRADGVPNYFGEQRFGIEFGNLPKALRFFNKQYRPKNRQERSLLISSARSLLFNEVTSQRIKNDSWDTVLEGDVLNLSGSHSVFTAVEDISVLQQRYNEGDLHISAPLYGTGETLVTKVPAEIEAAVFAEFPEYVAGLDKIGTKPARRAMRVIPEKLEHEWLDKKTLRLEFSLPAGAYATSVLRELVDYTVA